MHRNLRAQLVCGLTYYGPCDVTDDVPTSSNIRVPQASPPLRSTAGHGSLKTP